MEINSAGQSQEFDTEFQENLVVWKLSSMFVIFSIFTTFQENLVVWKYISSFCSIAMSGIVSGELSSMEILR